MSATNYRTTLLNKIKTDCDNADSLFALREAADALDEAIAGAVSDFFAGCSAYVAIRTGAAVDRQCGDNARAARQEALAEAILESLRTRFDD